MLTAITSHTLSFPRPRGDEPIGLAAMVALSAFSPPARG